MTDQCSKPGRFLDGRPLTPHHPFRLRPLGHRARLVAGRYGPVIAYEPDPEHLAAEPGRGP